MHSIHRLRRRQQGRIGQQARSLYSYDFFNVLTDSQWLDVVDRRLPPHRERLYPPIDTLALFMAQTLSPDTSCQQTVNRHTVGRVANGLPPCSTHTGAYCKARQRLPLGLVQALLRDTGRAMAESLPAAWRWRGRRVKLVDGTTVVMPDTPENQACYPQQRNQLPGLGFPIARVVGLLCGASGIVLDVAMGPYRGKAGSEHALFRTLMDSITADDLIVADRYYCTYWLIALLRNRGADVLFQQHHRRITDFRRGRRLGAGDHIVVWHKPRQRPDGLSQETYDALPETLRVRECRVGSRVLVTTLLSDTEAPRKALEALYAQRWNIELDLRHIKTTLGLEALHCKTPEMNEKEWWVGLLAYNLIRYLMAQSARHRDVLPRQLSFKHTLQLWLVWMHGPPAGDENLDVLFALIAQQRVAARPGRVEPRAVKRRPKPFPLLMKPRLWAQTDILLHGHPKKLK